MGHPEGNAEFEEQRSANINARVVFLPVESHWRSAGRWVIPDRANVLSSVY